MVKIVTPLVSSILHLASACDHTPAYIPVNFKNAEAHDLCLDSTCKYSNIVNDIVHTVNSDPGLHFQYLEALDDETLAIHVIDDCKIQSLTDLTIQTLNQKFNNLQQQFKFSQLIAEESRIFRQIASGIYRSLIL